MAAREPPLSGADLLDAVTDSLVTLHERYHHRKPVTANTRLMGDDLLVCVLSGVYTDVEKTMIELQRSTIVQETRSAFQRTPCKTDSSTRRRDCLAATSWPSSQTTTSGRTSRSRSSC
jgi:Na+-translocating membrane potential-generating system (MpsC)